MVFVEKIKREALVKRRMALIGIGLAGLISSFSHADDGYAAYEVLTSKELANKSILAFESFTCSVWADLMGDQKASEAFLLNGYDHGREPYRVCRRLNILRDYSDEKTKLYPRN